MDDNNPHAAPRATFGSETMTPPPPHDQSSQPSEEVVRALGGGASAETLAMIDQLRNPPQQTWAKQIGVLAISLILFVSLGLLQWSAAEIAILIVVLLVHESGHYLAMRAFGYRDVRMFFIPLFGAAVSGSGASATGSQRTLVALAGPFPGIVVGLVLAFMYAVSGQPLVRYTAVMFLALNAFNLLPLLPLDGGHVLAETVFCRSRWLEAAFQGAAGVALLLLAVVSSDVLFALLGLFMFASLPFSIKVSRIIARLREGGEVPLVRTPSEASLEFLLRVSSEVNAAFPQGLKPPAMLNTVRAVIEKLHPTPPAVAATILLLGAYGIAFVFAVMGAVLLVLRQVVVAGH